MTTLAAVALVASTILSHRQPAPMAVAEPPRPAPVVRLLRGRASWVSARYGSSYLAARLPRGTELRVCGPLACFVGTVNDYGPSRRVFPGRVVDLSRARFARVCGDPETLGTCSVRVAILGLP